LDGSDRDRRLDHIVVLMFENRSFDNLLGRLYSPEEVPSFEGILDRRFSNPVPGVLRTSGPSSVATLFAPNLDTPDPDPGEEYPHVNTQLFGTVLPSDNATRAAKEMTAPFNLPEPRPTPSMDGFVTDYVNTFRSTMGRWPRPSEYAQIMATYSPEQMPVISALARGFACFDHWFCEVPSQTYCNRSFFHAATSSGMLLNASTIGSFPVDNNAETIFERLESKGLTWRVYVDPNQIVSATGLIHASRLAKYFPTHFRGHLDFYEDARNGELPTYSFIEPCLIPPHSDMHPPGAGRLRHLLHIPRPSALRRGEDLLAKVYNSIKNSRSEKGSNWKNTLLLVTFDEHGGTFDHVAPPSAPPPDPAGPTGEMGFKFDRSGVRIPTIAISAWVGPRTVVNSEFRSTSLIRTLRERWSLGAPLTQRDAVAADIAPVLTLTEPREPSDWPEVIPPRLHTTLARIYHFLDSWRPLSPLGRHLFGAALEWETHSTGRPQQIDLHYASRRAALRKVRSLKAAAFPLVTRSR
jgi:phospholipase C